MAWISLCDVAELVEAQGKYVEVDGYRLAVFMVGGRYHVMDNTCPHAGGSLAAGHIEGNCVLCPWHYWGFDLATGQLHPGGGFEVSVYPTRVYESRGVRFLQADLPTP